MVFFRSDTDKTERANVMVTSGALLFILVAATLVTATFLMSPVIEDAFGIFNFSDLGLIFEFAFMGKSQ